MTDTNEAQAEMQADFDAEAALDAQPAKDLAAALDGRTLNELRAMLDAEKAGKNRVTVREVLLAEMSARFQAKIAESLSDETMQKLAEFAYAVASAPGEPLTDEQRAAQLEGAYAVLTDPAAPDLNDPFTRAVVVLAPLFADLQAATNPVADRGTIDVNDRADLSERKPDTVAHDIVALEFLSAGDTVEFSVPVKRGEFERRGLRLVYTKQVMLLPNKRRVKITGVAAVNAARQVVGLVRLPVPLQGGDGLTAKFPAGSIGVTLPA